MNRPPSNPKLERWLFLIHVDWRWIRQRPHWFAEESHRDNDVRVAYRMNPERRSLPANASDVERFPLLPLPLGRALPRRTMSNVLSRLQRAWVLVMLRRFRPTHVYITHPKMLPLLPRRIRRKAVLVYDCMDDALAMAPPAQQARLGEIEQELARDARVVVASSRTLATRVAERFGHSVRDKTLLVQNGVSAEVIHRARSQKRSPPTDVTVGYAGTVAHWFDFDSVTFALDRCESLRLKIIGPRTGCEPHHPRIEYVPPMDFEALIGELSECACLIMPFKVNEIVTAVNPVKLYEYLAYGVPVVVRRYEELEPDFGPFVEFYDSRVQLAELFQRLGEGRLASKADVSAVATFLAASTWEERWDQIDRAV